MADTDEDTDPVRARLAELEAALRRERQRSTALEHRADYLEAALKRSYAMVVAAPRVRVAS